MNSRIDTGRPCLSGPWLDERLVGVAPASRPSRAPHADAVLRHNADRSDIGAFFQRHEYVRQSVAYASETVLEHFAAGTEYCLYNPGERPLEVVEVYAICLINHMYISVRSYNTL